MKFFVDTAEVSEIIELNDLGMVDGIWSCQRRGHGH